MNSFFQFLFYYCFAILPGYLLPILGVFLSTRPYAKHWWPTLPEVQLVSIPAVLYCVLLYMNDRQGYSIGLPSLIIAIPVLITLWLGPFEHNLWIPLLGNIAYWIGFACSVITVFFVYMFFPYGSLRY